MAKAVKALGYPMVLNFVLHRHNIGQIDRIIELAIQLDADDVELATCQFYGWAHLNREGLLPTREQIADAEAVVKHYRERMAAEGKLANLLFVTPDYYEERPKGCMGGWGDLHERNAGRHGVTLSQRPSVADRLPVGAGARSAAYLVPLVRF